MSEMSFEQMLEESLKTIHTGEIVEVLLSALKRTKQFSISDTSQMEFLHVTSIQITQQT